MFNKTRADQKNLKIADESASESWKQVSGLRSLDSEYLDIRDSIPTGLKLVREYEEARERILKVLRGTREDWDSYRWQLKNRVSDVEVLKGIIHLSENEIREIEVTGRQYRWSVSPHYLSLMDPEDSNCPIRLQAIPSIKEYMGEPGLDYPMNVDKQLYPPLVARLYPDRLIIKLTNMCSMFCRHCQRKRDIDSRDVIHPMSRIREAIDYVRENDEVRDVLLTGGDALALSDDQLDYILTELGNISHVEIKRLGSRMPCVMPQRITPELCEILSKHDPVYLNTQFNHPREVTVEAQRAVDMLTRSGVVVRDQTVLLKRINDDPHVMKKLMQELLKIKVAPYYLFDCKKVDGIRHFGGPLDVGLNIIKKMRGFTSGMAVPTFIKHVPDARGKVPIYPRNQYGPVFEDND